jgi:hypothetical protein
MPIERISTTDTWFKWVSKTQELIIRVPEFLDTFEDSANVKYANTNLNIAYDVNVGENVNVRGNFIFVDSVYDDLNVSGNLISDGTLTTANAVVTEITVINTGSIGNFQPVDLPVVDVTTENLVSGDANVYNLIVTDSIDLTEANVNVVDFIVSENVSSLNVDVLHVGTEANVYQNLQVNQEITTYNAEFTNVETVNLFLQDVVFTDFFIVNDTQNFVENLQVEDVQSVDFVGNTVNSSLVSVTQNLNTLNVTNDLKVASDLIVYQNLGVDDSLIVFNYNVDSALINSLSVNYLTISENISEENVSTEIHVGNDVFVYGNLEFVSGNASFNNGLNQLDIVNNAVITNMIGTANDEIYNAISNSLSVVTVASNISNFLAFTLALG